MRLRGSVRAGDGGLLALVSNAAELPRVHCKHRRIKQTAVPWSERRSSSAVLETIAIDWLHHSGTAAVAATGGRPG